jgi:hypothetical protein
VKFVATRKKFHPSSFDVVAVASRIKDQGSEMGKNQDPG